MIGIALSMASNPSQVTVIQQAIAVLRKYGSDAHVYLPGVGMLNGLTAGNYLHTDGVTPGKVDDPVGLVLDAAGGLGVELIDTCNTAAAWTPYGANTVVQNGALIEITYVSGTSSEFGAQISLTQAGGLTQDLVAGKTYQVNMLAKVNTGSVSIAVLNSVTVPNTLSFPVTSTTLTPISFIFSYISGTPNFATNATLGAGEVISLSNISVREVTGIRSSQPTTASKPILRRGAVNLLTYSGDFGNAAWTKQNQSIATGVADPFGGTLASTITATATTCFVRQGVAMASGQTYTTVTYLRRRVGTGAVFVYIGPSVLTTPVTLAAEWTPFVQTVTGDGLTAQIGVLVATSGDSVDIYRAALFQGTYTAQQIQALGGVPLTLTAPASTALGSMFWQFDGSNDSLTLGGPLFQPGDDFYCGIAATYSGTGSANKTLIEPCGTSGTAAGRVGQIGIDSATSKLHGQWVTDALTVVSLKDSAVVSVGVPFVASVSSSAGAIEFRKDAVVTATGTAPSGTTTVTGGTIGARGTSALEYFGGNTNFGVVVKGLVSTSEKMLLDKLMANFQGRTL